MAYQYLVQNTNSRVTLGTNTLAVAQSYSNIPGYRVFDTSGQNELAYDHARNRMLTIPIAAAPGFTTSYGHP